jgi:hypothetical protein
MQEFRNERAFGNSMNGRNASGSGSAFEIEMKRAQ